MRAYMPVWKLARKSILKALGGVADTSLAAAGGFSVGLLALNTLDVDHLGAYSVLFAGYLAGTVIPRSFHFAPAEAAAASARIGPVEMLLRSIRTGSPGLLVGAAVAVSLALLGGSSAATTMTLVAVACLSVISPIQDHARQLLHLSARTRSSVVASSIYCSVTVGCTMILWGDHTAELGRFFWILIAGNAASLVPLVARFPGSSAGARDRDLSQIPARQRLWLLGGALTPMLVLFTSRSIVAGAAGYDEAGYAEAARTLLAPIAVVSAGLLSAFRNHVLIDRIGVAGLKWRTLLRTLILAAALGWWLVLQYGPVSGVARSAAPAAYALSGMLLLTALSEALIANASVLEVSAMGRRRFRSIAATQLVVSLSRLALVYPLASSIGAYALPATSGLGNLARNALLSLQLRMYGGHTASDHTSGQAASPSVPQHDRCTGGPVTRG